MLLKGHFKLFVGHGTGDKQINCTAGIGPDGTPPAGCVVGACWAGPKYPNSSVPSPNCTTIQICRRGGCLYNVFDDPEERVELSADPGHADVRAPNFDHVYRLCNDWRP